MVDTLYLEELIASKGLKKSFIAKEIGVPQSTFYRKLNNESEFSHAEALKLFNVLNCTEEQAQKIFAIM